jgi:hypothetical protein
MDKNDIRIGDEVEGVFRGVVKRKNGAFATLHTGRSVLYEDITRVLAREENKDDRIARLEARIAELEKQNGELAQGQLSRYRQRFPSMAAAWPEQKPEENLWYPKRIKGYGPWIEGPPPLGLTGGFEVLMPHQRDNENFYKFTFSGHFSDDWQLAVAHCIKED